MSLDAWMDRLQEHRAIAVIRAPSPNAGIGMARAVAAGGMRLIEIAWNGDRAPETIAHLRSHLPECTIGAGTLLSVADMQTAIAAGAQFLFSPHTDARLVDVAVAAGVPVIPGALSPTEIVRAWEAGASCVKVFPIAAMGGTSYLRQLRAPLGHIPLIPTGGVTPDNATDLLRAGAIAVGLSSGLFCPEALARGDWAAICDRAAMLVQRVRQVS